MKYFFRGLIFTGFMLYPFVVGYSLLHGHFFWVAIFLIALGIFRLFGRRNHHNSVLFPLTWLAILCGGLSLILKDQAWLKLYPVLMSLGAGFIFAMTLIRPPSMIERFARLVEPNLPESGIAWTRKVTIVWCMFFGFNATIALGTVLFANTQIWVLYNGVISYFFMGLLFAGEFILRKFHLKKLES